MKKVTEAPELLTVAERKLDEIVKVSNSRYSIKDCQLWITPEGDLNIRTRDGRDIVTVAGLGEDDMLELRDLGYFNDYTKANLEGDFDEEITTVDESKIVENKIEESSNDKLGNLISSMQEWSCSATTRYNDTKDNNYLELASLIEKVVEKAQKMIEDRNKEMEEQLEEK